MIGYTERSVASAVPGVVALVTDDGEVVIRSWHRTLRLSGATAPVARAVLDSLDGTTDLATVAHSLELEPRLVLRVVERLTAAGVVEPAGARGRSEAEGHALALASSGAGAESAVPAERTGIWAVVGSGPAATLVEEHLRSLTPDGARRFSDVESLRLALGDGLALGGALLAEESMTYDAALALNELATSGDWPWLASWWEGTRIVVTHELRRGVTACFECLLRRQRANYAQADVDNVLEQELRAGTLTTSGSHPHVPPTLVSSLLADLLVQRCSPSLLRGRWGRRPNEMAEYDLTSWDLDWWTVLRLPTCPVCAPAVVEPPRSLE